MADEEVVSAIADKKRATFTKERTKVVLLDYPFEFDGKLIDRVTIRRLSTAEVAAYYEELGKIDTGRIPGVPIFDVPQEAIDAMDDDDMFALEKEMAAFLPRRLQELVGSLPQPAGKSSEESPTS